MGCCLPRGRFCFWHSRSVFVSPWLRRPACPLYPTILHNNPTAGSRAVRLSVYCALVPSVAFPTLCVILKGSGRAAFSPFGFAPFLGGTKGNPWCFCLRGGVLCPSGWSGFFFFVLLSGVLFFFLSLSLVFSSFPWLLLRFPRPLPWCRLSASLPCSVGSLSASSVCRPRPAFPSRSGSPQRVRVSLRGCAVGSGVPGRSVGRWLACALRGSVCRCCRAASPPLAFSFLCFLNFF